MIGLQLRMKVAAGVVASQRVMASPCLPMATRPSLVAPQTHFPAVLGAGGRRAEVVVAYSVNVDVDPSSSAGEGRGMEQAAATLKSFCDTFPELPDEVMGLLLSNCPAIFSTPVDEVRTKLEALGTALGVPLPTAAKLVGTATELWERPVESTVEKVQLLASSLGGVPSCLVAELMVAQPSLWSINEVHLVSDRVDTLATRLALSIQETVRLIGRQPMLWAVDPRQMNNTVPAIAEALGLPPAEAWELVARMPVVIALDPKLLQLQVAGLSATMGVPLASMLRLITRSLGMISVPAEVLGSNLENLRLALNVGVEDVLDMVTSQPTLLCTQIASIDGAVSALSEGLQVSRSQALKLLQKEPALLYDFDERAIHQRLEALATAFETPKADIRGLASSTPGLLVMAPSTIKACLDVLKTQLQQDPKDCLKLLVQDPASFLMLGPQGNAETVEQWSGRLGISPRMVSTLIREQPGLLDLSPTTVKARLETLSALFSIPLDIAVQLVLKHPALAVIPPNTTITRVKSISLALGCSMQLAGNMVAKEPGMLCCTCGAPGELNRDLKPYADNIQEVVAAYEFYTMDWIQRQMKAKAPKRQMGFSSFVN